MNIAFIVRNVLAWGSACVLSGGILLAAVPHPPVGVSAQKISSAVVIKGTETIRHSVHIEWRAAPTGTRATGYRIYHRSEDDSTWSLLACASGSMWTLRESQIPPTGKEHFFYVTAYNKDGESRHGGRASVSFRHNNAIILPFISFTSSPPVSGSAGVDYEYKAQAVARNSGDIDYSIYGDVEGATIDRETGALSWKPEKAGDYTFTVQAVLRRNPAKSAVQTWTVRVPEPVVRARAVAALRFANSPDEEAIVYSPYTYQPQMSHTAISDVVYSLAEAPDGAEINEDGMITWTPVATGEYTFLLRASARTAKARSQTLMSWTVRVHDERGGMSKAGGYATPALSVKAYPNPATSEISVQFDASGPSVVALTDESGRVLYSSEWPAERGTTTAVINVTGFAAGRYYVRIETGNQMQAIPVAIVR